MVLRIRRVSTLMSYCVGAFCRLPHRVRHHFLSHGVAISVRSSRLLVNILSQSFAYLLPSTLPASASTCNQEGEVPTVVEVEGIALTAGIGEAADDVAATGFQGSFMAGAVKVSGNLVLDDQLLPISTQEPAEVADPELRALLRKHDVDERLTVEIGAQGVKSIADIVGLEGADPEKRSTLASFFGIQGSTVKGKVAAGRALNAWRAGAKRASEYEAIAAQCKVYGQPVDLQKPEYNWYIDSLIRSHGALLEDCDIPGLCYLESLVERVDYGLLFGGEAIRPPLEEGRG